MTPVDRIMSALTAYGVFGIRCEEAIGGSKIDKKLLSREYRLLALQVHPDKNDSPNAEAAFRKLHDSYEYLMSLESIVVDSDSSSNFKSTSNFNSGSEPKGCRNVPKPDSKEEYKEQVKPIRRSFKDIMKSWDEFERQFQEENSHVWKRYKRKRERTDVHSATVDFESLSELYLEGIDTRSCHWRSFKDMNCYNTSNRNDQTSLRQVGDSIEVTNVAENGCICWPCRRRFKSDELLHYHESMSALHQVNIMKM